MAMTVKGMKAAEALESSSVKPQDRKRTRSEPGSLAWEELLHPSVRAGAYAHYQDGHWRDSVLNAMIAVFDLVRMRTALDLDGDKLITRVFSSENPVLTVADVRTESGKNDQTGFMLMLQGVFRGVRNPKAHTLLHDLNELKAARYLVMASLFASRIEDAEFASREPDAP
jgi:uncharacterized protein (TIGR02391 family)